MSEFVEECRREWKRLGVPDPVANEMAADLAADLEEAQAEGASAQEVLGSGAFDPRSFAAAWAAERGLIQRPQGLRSRIPAAIGATFALIAIAGAVLLITASSDRRLGLPPPPALIARTPDGVRVVEIVEPMPRLWVRVIADDTSDSGVDARTAGSVLLIVGLAGSVPLMLLSLWGRSRTS